MTALLTDLTTLVLDCQATCTDPEKGYLLEIGWTKYRASETAWSSSSIETYLIRTPANAEIPRHVTWITGIAQDDLVLAHYPAEIWGKLAAAAHEVAAAGNRELCPAVIHFARFEEPYLRQLHGQNSPDTLFPFEIICTHELVKHLFPGLPRRGLRAIAGYFGHSVGELRRSTDHIAATACIWQKLVELLKCEQGVCTPDELFDFLASTAASSRSGRAYPMDPRTRLGLPDQPGVYRMLRSNGDTLYVGKARSLRQRVNSYFRKRNSHAEHILEMLTQAVNIDITVTGSALEAAILESDEIKRLSPPYNISLRNRDRKLWFCSGDLKKISSRADDIHTIGPFPSRESAVSLSTMTELLREGGTNDLLTRDMCLKILGIPQEYAPEMDCFREGFAVFLQKHSNALTGKHPVGALIRLGARLWWDRLEKNVDSGGSQPDPDNDTVEEEIPAAGAQQTWTPDSVAGALEGAIMRVAHALRRARWFCLLSESSLAWMSASVTNSHKNLVVFEKGCVLNRSDIPQDGEIPVPPGCKRQFHERQRYFDVTTHDRMRVVTTELRRLVAMGRNLELRLGSHSILHQKHLAKILPWV